MSMPQANEDLENRRAAVALYALCGDYGEVERLTEMLRTFPYTYGIPKRLVLRLNVVVSHLHELHDDAVK